MKKKEVFFPSVAHKRQNTAQSLADGPINFALLSAEKIQSQSGLFCVRRVGLVQGTRHGRRQHCRRATSDPSH